MSIQQKKMINTAVMVIGILLMVTSFIPVVVIMIFSTYNSLSTWMIVFPIALAILMFAVGILCMIGFIQSNIKNMFKKRPKKNTNYLTADGKKSPLSKKEIDRRRKLV